MFVLYTSQKAQLRAPLSPLQTAWTGFDPNLYSGGSSLAGPALVEIATARSFILNRGIVLFPPERGLLKMTHRYIN